MTEIIKNYLPPNLPTMVYEEGSTLFTNIMMDSSKHVNDALVAISTQLQGEGWSKDKPQYATSTFQIDLPLVDRAGAFSLIILYFQGKAFKMFNPGLHPPDVDPSGDVLTGVGPNGEDAVIIGVAVNENMGQNELIGTLASYMKLANSNYKYEGADPIDDPGSSLDGVYRQILITAIADGAEWNDLGGIGNVVGGGQFNGVTKLGGYDLNNPAGGDTRMKLTMWNNFTSNFTFRPHFLQGLRSNPENRTTLSVLSERVMWKRNNYVSFAGPNQWGIFPEFYLPYTPGNITEVGEGVSDYHFCGPHIIKELSNNPKLTNDEQIAYCGFAMAEPRFTFNSQNGCTCINDKFREGFFPGLDAGIVYMVYNSMYHTENPLYTTTFKPLKYSACILLSPGNAFKNRSVTPQLPWDPTPAMVYGFVPDMYMTTQAVPMGTIVVDEQTRRPFYAYRVQAAPCECTLWVGIRG